MIDQQAPLADRHSVEVDDHRLSINIHRISGGTILQRKKNVTRVSTELNKPLNRFDLIHPITPMLVKGGLISSIWAGEDRLEGCVIGLAHPVSDFVFCADSHRSINAIFLLYQFMNAEVTRLKIR